MTGIIFLPRLVFIIYLLKCFKCCIKTLRSTHIYLHTVTSLRHILILLDQSLSKHWKNRKRIRVMAISSDYSGKLGTVFESLKTLAVFEFKIYYRRFWVKEVLGIYMINITMTSYQHFQITFLKLMKVYIIFLQHAICIKHIHIEFRRRNSGKKKM